MSTVSKGPLKSRDDFTAATKRKLASRVGYVCSDPDCETPTVGPSDDAVTGYTHTGDAAHITAASELGPRYDARLTKAERMHADNGIWLCKKHASLIDSEHSRYSVELLQSWKGRAEEQARLDQGGTGIIDASSLFAHEQGIVTGEDEKAAKVQLTLWISSFFGDVGAKHLFRKSDRAVAENVVFELALNAHRHEGIRTFRITSKANTIVLEYASDTGYGLKELLDEAVGRGGFDSVEMLETETQGRMILNHRASERKSHWICSAIRLGYSDDPCAVNLHDKSDMELELFKSDCLGCEQVHVHGHLDDHSSDNWVTARYVKELVDEGYQVVVHSKPGPLANHLRKTIMDVLGGREDFEFSEHA